MEGKDTEHLLVQEDGKEKEKGKKVPFGEQLFLGMLLVRCLLTASAYSYSSSCF